MRFTATLCLTSLVAISGCTSLDPTKDVERAMANVRERSGYNPTWQVPWSQTPTAWDGKSELTLDQAVMAALQNNPTIRADLEEIVAARADLVQSGLLPNPVLSAFMRFPDDGVTALGATVVQQFTALWLRPSRIRAADAKLNETVLRVSGNALRLVADVRQACAKIVFGDRSVELTQKNIEVVERSIETMQRRVQAGEAISLDVNRLRGQLLSQRANLTRQQTEVNKFRRELLELMGLADTTADWPVNAQSVAVAPIPEQVLEEKVIELAKSQRLDVAASRFVYKIRREELGQERLSRLRDVGVGVDIERDTDGTRSVGPTVELSIPIFDMNQAKIAGAEAQFRAAQAVAIATLQRAVQQARSAWLDVKKAQTLADFYQQQVVELTSQNLTLTQNAVKAGQADVTTLLEAQREFIAARLELNQLQADAAIARIELEYAIGGRLDPAAPK